MTKLTTHHFGSHTMSTLILCSRFDVDVMGLNKVLEMTLASLSDENMLLSWSVFQEKSGQISVKILFEAANDAVNHIDDAHYHRKKALTSTA